MIKTDKCNNCKYLETWYHGEHSLLGMFTYSCTVGGDCSRFKHKKELLVTLTLKEGWILTKNDEDNDGIIGKR